MIIGSMDGMTRLVWQEKAWVAGPGSGQWHLLQERAWVAGVRTDGRREHGQMIGGRREYGWQELADEKKGNNGGMRECGKALAVKEINSGRAKDGDRREKD